MAQAAVGGMQKPDMVKNAVRAAVLIALIFALLFVLTFTGIMKCSQLPVAGEAWCNVYWTIKTYATGQPRVLIVYGDDGLGNPIGDSGNPVYDSGSLQSLLANPNILGVHADTMHISRVNAGNLRGYDIVIVDKARTLET
ncbi:MAG: hypothetical protein NTW59_02510, partial [Candidatus Diapherotrites archaeon]|nr:hypothetical protein [Candidatus Diapherotrites archaeon]